MPRTDLPTAPLGRTGLSLTRIGFGAGAIGGAGDAPGRGSQDDEDPVRAVRHAVDHGVNWIDTAAGYGQSHSEEMVRAALSPYSDSDRPYVFTTCGLVADDAHRDRVTRRAGDPRPCPADIRREVDASLRRLGVERIDLYQMHWPAQDDASLSDYWQVLLELRRAGKVRAVGLSHHDVKHLAAAEERGHVDSLRSPFSAIDREAAGAEIPWCAAHDTGVIVSSPVQSGLLTGAFSRERVEHLPADDRRRRDANFVGASLDSNLDLARRMGEVAYRHQVSLSAVAVAWTLAWPGVTGAVVGARDPDQVAGWLPAARLTLDSDDLDEIAEDIERSGAGNGPTRP